MYSKTPIEELVANVLQELKNLNYGERTRSSYRRFYNKLILFSKSQGENYYCKKLGNSFLATIYNFTLEGYKEAIPRSLRGPVRSIRVLTEYQLYGSISRRHSRKPPYKYPERYVGALRAFEQECDIRCYSPRSMRTRMNRLRAFVDYLDDQRVSCETLF